MNEIEKLRAEARDAPLLGHRFATRLRLGGYFATFSRDMTDDDFELLAMRLASIGDRFERATERTL